MKKLSQKINELYEKSGFLNNEFKWEHKLLELLQDNSIEAYNIYQCLTEEQKDKVLKELFALDNELGAERDGDINTSLQNLRIMLSDAKNGKKY